MTLSVIISIQLYYWKHFYINMWLTIWQLIAISKGTLCYVISICLDKLGISSSNCHFCQNTF